MEAAVALVNALRRKSKQNAPNKSLSDSDVAEVFAELQASRFDRALAAVLQGQRSNALVGKDTFLARMFVHHAFPWFGERLIMKLVVKSAETGAKIEDIAPPSHAVSRDVTPESQTSRILWGSGIVGVGVLAVVLYTYC